MQTMHVARNYDGIAQAQAEKPRRQVDRDALVPEQPLYQEGSDGAKWGGEAQNEVFASDQMTTLRQNVDLAHRFNATDLNDIITYRTAERRQALIRELGSFFLNSECSPSATCTCIYTM